ncbi:hypothetical protein HaLaN_18869, partial [Haematococcus lacustris]
MRAARRSQVNRQPQL